MKKNFFFVILVAVFCLAGCNSNECKAISVEEVKTETEIGSTVETGSQTMAINQSENVAPDISTLEADDIDPYRGEIEYNDCDNPEDPKRPEPTPPVNTGSGDFQDYWLSDTEFDIVHYMEDNGFKVTEIDLMCQKIEPGSIPDQYGCTYEDWQLVIGSDGLVIYNKSSDACYDVTYNDEDVTINICDCVASRSDLWALPVAIYNMKNGASNPFEELDETYTVHEY